MNTVLLPALHRGLAPEAAALRVSQKRRPCDMVANHSQAMCTVPALTDVCYQQMRSENAGPDYTARIGTLRGPAHHSRAKTAK